MTPVNASPPRTHDARIAREYVELDPFNMDNPAHLQKHLATAQAVIRVQAAELARRERETQST
jgi:hypothetical protein